LSRDAVAQRFRARGASLGPTRFSAEATPAARRGDDDLNPGLVSLTGLRDAAVLVPLVDRAEGLTVLLTQRTEHLNAHAGQISFPGGRVEDSDADAVAAALRETEEELGLPPSHVEVIGQLDLYVTRTGYSVTPVVGFVNPPFTLNPDPFEVAEAFEVPLAFLIDPANHQRHSRVLRGAERWFYAMPYGKRYIWGATAGMIVNLSEVLGAAPPGTVGRDAPAASD
jgi:8-oxo-dGTP pyrophosphatase MutT (NUDIX family)